MSWVFFSILAAMIWAAANIVDKQVITRWLREPAIPVIFMGIVGLIMSAIIFSVRGIQPLSPFNVLLAFAAGTFYMATNVFYFNGLKRDEVSRVVPMYYVTPIFVLMLATIFLGESFESLTYLGIFLVVSGIITISVRRKSGITISKAVGFMVMSALLWSVYSIIIKYLLGFADFWTVFAYARAGTIFVLVPLMYAYLPRLLESVREHGKKIVIVMSANEAFNIIGVVSAIVALSMGYASLVETLTSTHPFFILLFALILSIFFPRIMKEEFSRSTVMIKLVAIILIFAGAVIITQ